MIADIEANAVQRDGFAELSMRQVAYMETITALGHPRLSELAEALSVSRPSVSVLVDRLIRKGYIHKIQDGADRRSYRLSLTEKGREFTQAHHGMHRYVVETLVSRLERSEVEQLAGLLNKALGT